MEERIHEQEEIIKELRERLTLPALNYNERVLGSKNHDTFEQKMVLSLDKQMQLAELVFNYELFRYDILMKVLELKGEEHYTVILYDLYFRFKSIQETAKDLGLYYNYVTKLRGQALDIFYDQYMDKGAPRNPSGPEQIKLAS